MQHRWLAGASATGLLLLVTLGGTASATGPGGWDHLGGGATAGTPALNGTVSALNTDRPNTLYVGGSFTAAGGVAGADRIAAWNGTTWSAVSSAGSQIANGLVDAIAYDSVTGKLFVGGTFTNAGGDANADFLAAWNGTSWAPFCSGAANPPITATVYALQIIGRTLYVAGAFADGAGIASADRIVACNLDTGAASSTVLDVAHAFSGTVYALAADSNGDLYAGGGFTDLGGDPSADNVAYLDGTGWHAMGSGAGTCSCAVNDFVRSLTAVGTSVYVGTDAQDVAGIAQADHVVRWNGAAWSAVGSNTAGTDGWFPASAFIYGLTSDGTNLYATGSFQNANGDPTADAVAKFDGSSWHSVGSDGAGNGPWIGNGLALAFFSQQLDAGGGFTSAGGDSQAGYAAAYPGLFKLTVYRGGSGFGSIRGLPAFCGGGACSASYLPGTNVTLHGEDSTATTFVGWSGGGCTGTADCHLTMNADMTITAMMLALPLCQDSSATVTGGVPQVLQLPCHDWWIDDNPITYSITSGPSHGALGPISGNQVTYTPAPGYTGSDTFAYTGLNEYGGVTPESVSITVTQPPPASNVASVGFSQASANVALLLGTLTPNTGGQLSFRAHNSNPFDVQAISVNVTSLAAVAARTPAAARRKVVTFLKISSAVRVAAGKTVTVKGVMPKARLAQLKRLRQVRVRVRVVLRAPNGTRRTITSKGTLRAPKGKRR
jgi:hypothetical protein